MNRIEISFADLAKGDTVVRLSRSGQTPSVVEEVFTLKSGDKAFRTVGNDNPGVYYTKQKFVFAYREATPPRTRLDLLIDKVKEDIKWHADQMERIGNSEDPSYAFHLGWVDSMSSVRIRLEKMQ